MRSDVFEKAAELKKAGVEFVLVTVAAAEGSSPGHPGTKMIVTSSEAIGTVGGGAMEAMAIDRARELLVERACDLKSFDLGGDETDPSADETGMICGGQATLFFEYFPPAETAYLWGGGHIGRAVFQHLTNIGFKVVVIDDRPEMVDSFGGAAILSEFEDFDEPIREGAYHLIATHGHEHDYAVLRRIFASDWKPKYIGLISSRGKLASMIEELRSDVAAPNLDLLYSPVGLDIGGDSPEEIAISIVAEIQAVRYGKKGHKHLRRF